MKSAPRCPRRTPLTFLRWELAAKADGEAAAPVSLSVIGDCQLNVTAVSSMTNDVWRELFSTPLNFSARVCPANDDTHRAGEVGSGGVGHAVVAGLDEQHAGGRGCVAWSWATGPPA